MSTNHTCPRRAAQGLDRADSPFRNSGPNLDTYRSDGCCDYCGSLHPDEFMRRCAAGDVMLGATDKNYKVYVTNAGGAPFKQTYRTDDLPFAGWDNPVHTWVTRETDRTKFYFQHLSREQMVAFVAMMNARILKFDGGEGFYVLPFFCVR